MIDATRKPTGRELAEAYTLGAREAGHRLEDNTWAILDLNLRDLGRAAR